MDLNQRLYPEPWLKIVNLQFIQDLIELPGSLANLTAEQLVVNHIQQQTQVVADLVGQNPFESTVNQVLSTQDKLFVLEKFFVPMAVFDIG